MNEKQYKILKIFTDWPKANLQKVSKAFKLDYMVVVAVATSHNYENFLALSKGDAGYDFMSMFGGAK